MQISQVILEKVRLGNALSDDELIEAHKFFSDLAESLSYLGPEWSLAFKAARPEKDSLERFLVYRARKDTNDTGNTGKVRRYLKSKNIKW